MIFFEYEGVEFSYYRVVDLIFGVFLIYIFIGEFLKFYFMLVISVFGKFEKGYFILIMVEIVVGFSFFWGY